MSFHIAIANTMDKLNITYLLLGSNLGDRYNFLQKAKNEIVRRIGEVISESSIYETEPIGFDSDNNFLNVVVKVSTNLSPQLLLQTILETEKELGRIREGSGYSSRTIDIDIMYYNQKIILEDNLEIPHPRICERKFALIPLVDVARDLVHPVYGKTQHELLTQCGDKSKISIYKHRVNEA